MTSIPSSDGPELAPAILEAARNYESLAERAELRERGRGEASPAPTTCIG